MFHSRIAVIMVGLAVLASPLAFATVAVAVTPSTVGIGDAVVYEGNYGFTTARVVLTLSDPQASDLFVSYTTVTGTATGGTPTSSADFVSRSGRIKFRAGKTNAFIAVKIIGDAIADGDEAFGVVLSNPTSAGVALIDDTATVTIRDDDPNSNAFTPTIGIGDSTIYEGDIGFTTARVGITLSDPQPTDVFVNYATLDGSSIGGTTTSGADFVHRQGRIKFAAGRTNAVIALKVNGDTSFEPDESFGVTLSNVTLSNLAPTSVALLDDSATITVRTDDASPLPDTPTALDIAPGPSPRHLTATWSPPTGGAIVAGYDIEITDLSSIDVYRDVTSPHTFGCGITMATASCSVRVRAVNASGTSPWSDPTAVSTWALPGTPLNVRILGNDAIEWDAPASDRPILSYIVEKSIDAALSWSPVTTTSNLNALTTCTACLLRIAAASEVGLGAFAQFDYLTPLPGVPTLLAAVPGPLNRYLTATWSAPTDGSPVSGYDLEVVRGATTNVLSNVTSPSVFGCGLASVTDTCTLRVRAHNTAGPSDWSASATASTWAPPSAPPNLTASGTTVFWDAPASDQPVINYWVFKSLDNGGSWTAVTTTTNLHASATCSICLIRVQAQSSVGFGASSIISIAFSPPSPPVGLVVTRDVTNPALLHITWSPPLSATPPVDSYTVTISDFTFQVNITGITGTTLDYGTRNPTALLISVVALNAAGMSSPATLLVPAG